MEFALSFVTYLITFSTYGTHLHGDPRGSVDPKHNQPGAPLRPPEPALERYERSMMREDVYLLDQMRREIVLAAIVKACEHRGWDLLAAHVRTNHVHVVVASDVDGGRIVHDFKAYASRSLKEAGVDGSRERRWTRHASMRRVGEANREAAIRYVIDQGTPMALFVLQRT